MLGFLIQVLAVQSALARPVSSTNVAPGSGISQRTEEGLPSDSCSLTAPYIRAANPCYQTLKDVIHPAQLNALTEGKDYILLTHRPGDDMREKIQREGLRSLADLATDENAPPSLLQKYNYRRGQRHFGNDPYLIYFRPVVDRGHHKILDNDVVIAIRPDTTYVCDQEHRAGGTCDKYVKSCMTVERFRLIMADRPSAKCLNRYGEFDTCDYRTDFIAETALKANRISPDLFVKHSDIKK